MLQITRRDYERLFGQDDVAMGRLRNFCDGYACERPGSIHRELCRWSDLVPEATPEASGLPATDAYG